MDTIVKGAGRMGRRVAAWKCGMGPPIGFMKACALVSWLYLGMEGLERSLDNEIAVPNRKARVGDF